MHRLRNSRGRGRDRSSPNVKGVPAILEPCKVGERLGQLADVYRWFLPCWAYCCDGRRSRARTHTHNPPLERDWKSAVQIPNELMEPVALISYAGTQHFLEGLSKPGHILIDLHRRDTTHTRFVGAYWVGSPT